MHHSVTMSRTNIVNNSYREWSKMKEVLTRKNQKLALMWWNRVLWWDPHSQGWQRWDPIPSCLEELLIYTRTTLGLHSILASSLVSRNRLICLKRVAIEERYLHSKTWNKSFTILQSTPMATTRIKKMILSSSIWLVMLQKLYQSQSSPRLNKGTWVLWVNTLTKEWLKLSRLWSGTVLKKVRTD